MLKCGIDIGGTNIKIGFFEDDKKVDSIVFKTPKEHDRIISTIVDVIKRKYNPKNILGYTVAIPGVVLNDVVVFAPNTDIFGLNFKEELGRQLNNQNIIVENDANLQAMAEARATRLYDLILISIGTGLGGGIIIDGKLLNKNGFAGEIGHIKVHFGANSRMCGCGKLGCSEAYVSCKAIVKEYNEVNHTSINSKELFDLARAKDKLAIKCINDCARYLAITIATVVATTGIKEVHIAGGLSNAGEVFLRRVRYFYPKYCVRNMEDVKIKQAYLQYEAGTHAAKYLIGEE